MKSNEAVREPENDLNLLHTVPAHLSSQSFEGLGIRVPFPGVLELLLVQPFDFGHHISVPVVGLTKVVLSRLADALRCINNTVEVRWRNRRRVHEATLFAMATSSGISRYVLRGRFVD